MSGLSDERSLRVGNRTAGIFGPRSSSLLLTWLASHRGRLRTFLLGGHRLSLLLVWDMEGVKECPERTETEVDAMAVVAFGPKEVNDV